MRLGPSGEEAALVAVQSALAGRPGVLAGARALSHFGEHSIGWLAVAGLGALLSPGRRRAWLAAGDRGVRRARCRRHHQARCAQGTPAPPGHRGERRHPEQTQLPVRARHLDHRSVDTDGAGRPGCRLPALLVPPMALSRLVLGVHYPSDVITGVAVGTAVAKTVGYLADRAEGDS